MEVIPEMKEACFLVKIDHCYGTRGCSVTERASDVFSTIKDIGNNVLALLYITKSTPALDVEEYW